MTNKMNDFESEQTFSAAMRAHQASASVSAMDPTPQRGLLEVAWAGKRIVAACVAIGVVGALIYLNVVEPRYTSTAKLLVEKDAPAVLPGSTSKFATSSKNYLNTHATILRADPVLQRAVEIGGLEVLPAAQESGSAFAYLKNNLVSYVNPQDDILVVELESNSPETSRQMVDCVVQAYVDYQGGEIKDSAEDRMAILESHLATLQDEFRIRQEALLEFQGVHQDTALVDDRGSAVLRRLGLLNDRMTEAELQVHEATQDYELAATQLADLSDIDHWRDQLAALVLGSKIASMDGLAYQNMIDTVNAYEISTNRFGENHPAVRSANREKVNLEAVITEREKLAADTLLAHLIQVKNSAEGQLQDLRTAVTEQQQIVLDFQDMHARLVQLQNAVEQSRDDISLAEQRLREAEAVVATPQNISVLEKPVDGKKTFPKPANQVLLIGIGLGFVTGVLLSLPLGLREDRKRATLLAAQMHGIPTIGTVPPIPDAASKLNTISNLNSLSDVVEAYRVVRTALDINTGPNAARSFLVTSPSAGDGKTTTIAGLALTMARPDQQPVLVIDADIRCGVLHEKFGADNDIGLSEVLQGRVSLDDAIQETSIQGLFLLPKGAGHDDPSRLLGRSAFRMMLENLDGRFDRILVDSPPALVADTAILAAQIDATLMVLRYGKSTQSSTMRAIDTLKRAKANIIGSVTNSLSERVRDKSYLAYGYTMSSVRRSDALFATPSEAENLVNPPSVSLPNPPEIN
ncbi:MAG: polysaccharide biosynthesis tyrosine autokinase [Planctomycetota bacterium]